MIFLARIVRFLFWLLVLSWGLRLLRRIVGGVLWNEEAPGSQAADAGSDRGADAIRLGGDVEARVLFGLTRSRDDELREPVHAPGLLVVDPVRRLEVLHLAREPDRVLGGVEVGDRARAALSANQRVPAGPHVVAERRERPETRDDDAPAPVE